MGTSAQSRKDSGPATAHVRRGWHPAMPTWKLLCSPGPGHHNAHRHPAPAECSHWAASGNGERQIALPVLLATGESTACSWQEKHGTRGYTAKPRLLLWGQTLELQLRIRHFYQLSTAFFLGKQRWGKSWKSLLELGTDQFPQSHAKRTTTISCFQVKITKAGKRFILLFIFF